MIRHLDLWDGSGCRGVYGVNVRAQILPVTASFFEWAVTRQAVIAACPINKLHIVKLRREVVACRIRRRRAARQDIPNEDRIGEVSIQCLRPWACPIAGKAVTVMRRDIIAVYEPSVRRRVEVDVARANIAGVEDRVVFDLYIDSIDRKSVV